MKIVIVGAGPSGLYLAMSLARRGHHITIIDRDPGPTPDGAWVRKGVMQFRLPHFFRPQVRDALLAEVPEVASDLVAAGAILTPVNPMMPDFLGLRVRRVTFERVLRRAALGEPGVAFVIGHVSQVRVAGDRACGVVVDGNTIDADLVIDAAGRNGRFSDQLRKPAIGGDSGFAYASRQYELLPGAEAGPLNAPPGWVGVFDGYQVIVFLQDARTFQTLIVRRRDDAELAPLRRDDVFDVVARAIPPIADWTDPQRAVPQTSVMSGAGLNNNYRGQLNEEGRIEVRALVFVGDAVLTTNPAAGRGVTTSMMQARRLLAILDEHREDLEAVSLDFDQWCTENIRPWFDDHVNWDAGLIARWRGEPIDLTKPMPSDLICALAEIDKTVMPLVGAYQGMFAKPAALSAVEERAREAFQSGFRPAIPQGPTRDELVDLIARMPDAVSS
jgi:2-polyprenyl-6-methoxyphenol hydroxylase-like FAD-dependent oxidoreductase